MSKINKNALGNFEPFRERCLCMMAFPGTRDYMKVMQWQWTQCFAWENNPNAFSTHTCMSVLQSYCKEEFQTQMSYTSSAEARLLPGSYSINRKQSATSLHGNWCRQESMLLRSKHCTFLKIFQPLSYILFSFFKKCMCMGVLPGYICVCVPLVCLMLTEVRIGYREP